MIRVKICGITNLDDALLASAAGADAVGFIFSKKSPRYISLSKAKGIIRSLDPFLTRAGVFLNQDKQEVLDIATTLNLDILQFHGKETPQYCSCFKPRFKIVKVFFPEDSPYQRKILRYKVDAFMFDMKYEDKMKNKKALPAKDLKEISGIIKSGKRVVISGGLNVINVDSAVKLKPYALDVSSGVESMIGRKDSQLTETFIKKVKYETA